MFWVIWFIVIALGTEAFVIFIGTGHLGLTGPSYLVGYWVIMVVLGVILKVNSGDPAVAPPVPPSDSRPCSVDVPPSSEPHAAARARLSSRRRQ